AAHRQPAIALEIQDNKEVARKKWRPNRFELASVADRFLNLRKVGPKSLCSKMQLSFTLALWLRMDEKPPLARREFQGAVNQVQHGKFNSLNSLAEARHNNNWRHNHHSGPSQPYSPY